LTPLEKGAWCLTEADFIILTEVIHRTASLNTAIIRLLELAPSFAGVE